MNTEHQTRLFNREFSILIFCHFLQALGWSTMLLLPRYFDHLGYNGEAIGTLMASASIGGLCIRPIIGWALDCYGKRLVLTLGSLLLTIGMLTLSTETPTYEHLLAARILVGLGAGTLFTGYFAFVALHIPQHRRTEGLALFGISGILPMALNTLASRYSADPQLIRSLFPLLCMPIVISGVLIWLVPEKHTENGKTEHAKPFLLKNLFTRNLIPVWIATLTFSGQVAAFMAFATLNAPHEVLSSAQDIWLFYASGAVGIRLFASRLPDRLGPSNFIVPSLASYCGAFILLENDVSATHYYSAGLLAGLGHGYCFPVLTAQVIDRIQMQATSRGLALFTALWEITALGATAPLGAFADRFGLQAMNGLVACLSLILMSLWVVIEHRWANANNEATQLKVNRN